MLWRGPGTGGEEMPGERGGLLGVPQEKSRSGGRGEAHPSPVLRARPSALLPGPAESVPAQIPGRLSRALATG